MKDAGDNRKCKYDRHRQLTTTTRRFMTIVEMRQVSSSINNWTWFCGSSVHWTLKTLFIFDMIFLNFNNFSIAFGWECAVLNKENSLWSIKLAKKFNDAFIVFFVVHKQFTWDADWEIWMSKQKTSKKQHRIWVRASWKLSLAKLTIVNYKILQLFLSLLFVESLVCWQNGKLAIFYFSIEAMRKILFIDR